MVQKIPTMCYFGLNNTDSCIFPYVSFFSHVLLNHKQRSASKPMCRPRAPALGRSLCEPQSEALIIMKEEGSQGPASELRAPTLEGGSQARLGSGIAQRHSEVSRWALRMDGHLSSPIPVTEWVCCDLAMRLYLCGPCFPPL